MSLKKISMKLGGAILFILPVFSFAENSAPGITRSGELLQNNPMLHTPTAPRSKQKEQIGGVDRQHVEAEEESGPVLYVKRINISDVPPSSRDDVEQLLAAYRGKEMTLSALRNVAVTVTALLQSHGEKLVFAYIPDQNIKDGTVLFKIFRGHIESVSVNSNTSLVDGAVVGRFIDKMREIKGDANASENYLSRLSDLPGVGALSSFLSPGKELGGSALHLDLAPSPRFSGVAVFDNMGSVSSGRDRLGLQVNVNSPFGYGDRLQALAYASPDFLQINHDSEHGNTFIGRLSYDLPINGRGTRLGAAFSRVSYKLGGPVYSGLGDGYAEVASLYGSHPLIRSNEQNLNLAFTADFKRIEDTFWGMNNTRTAPVLTLQITGDKQGSLLGLPNILQHDVSVSAGRLSNNDEWNGLDTRGHFVKLNADMKLLQSVTSGVYASVHVVAQQASKNLDGAEKISLGGPYAVRAYSNSIASADNAVLISPAINFSVPGVEGLSTELFYDYAKGKIQKFSPQSTKVSLAGYGIGLNYNFNSVAFINASYAWRKGETELISHQNKAMGWITVGFQF